ncbi:2-dehydropantoate 2-reductase [Paraglaciecola sp.]|uniref:ketopantoate reductase family protein n=1 Tax=Paraglaciecola sp. TaxID=1920173 RepID=UPI0030F406F3
MKISIIGNGAIGNTLAFSCHQLKIDYQVFTRSGLETQLKVTDSKHKQWQLPLPVVPSSALRDSELIILPLKAYQIAEFIEQNQTQIQPWQTLVLLHNGMGTIETTLNLMPDINLIAATTSYGAFKPDADTLHIKGQGESHYGWVKKQADGQHVAIEQLLSTLLPPSTWHADIRLALWLKLAINAAINPLSALYQVNNGELSAERFQTQIIGISNEISQVMAKLGFMQEPTALLRKVNKVIEDTANNFSSMNRDVVAKRPTEIDFINGYIIKQAQQYGIPCPLNLNLYNEIKALERGYGAE